MKQHPWFPSFCAAVGVGPERWGTAVGDPQQEYMLFTEWLSEVQKDSIYMSNVSMCSFSFDHACMIELLCRMPHLMNSKKLKKLRW